MLAEVIVALDPKPGDVAVDCTLGFAGHAAELLRRLGPDGRLIAVDLDAANLEPARSSLEAIGSSFVLRHGNFAALPAVLAESELDGCDCLLADLGMSSMQLDDPERGFSFARDGPLDMRMDRTRSRTAAELLNTLSESELSAAFRELGDEPQAERIAAAIIRRRAVQPLERTRELMELILESAPVAVNPHPRKGEPTPRQQQIRPTARVFQALRILVNRELANLQELLRVLPWCLRPGGRVAIITFHSGEDRLVKAAFKEGLRTGVYAQISEEPVRPTIGERMENPRSRSAKMRWAIRASDDFRDNHLTNTVGTEPARACATRSRISLPPPDGQTFLPSDSRSFKSIGFRPRLSELRTISPKSIASRPRLNGSRDSASIAPYLLAKAASRRGIRKRRPLSSIQIAVASVS
jgi:16S rRNA (cytosine1402-N4)-methyltransferase